MIVALPTTAFSLIPAYPIDCLLALRLRPEVTRIVLLLLTIPCLVNYVIRNFAWAYRLGRNGSVNRATIALGLTDRPLDWLLFGDFSDRLSFGRIQEHAIRWVRLLRAKAFVVPEQSRAVGTEDHVVRPHIEVNVRMVVRRGRAGAFEFSNADLDLRNAPIVLELRIVFTGHHASKARSR